MEIALLVALVVFLVVASALDWMAVEVAALVVLAGLLVGGLVTLEEAVSGFADDAVLTVLLMMILSSALVDSGLVAQLGHRLGRLARGSFRGAFALLLLVAVSHSLFANNTATLAMLLPIGIQLASQHRTSPSKLLLPLNYAVIFGGTLTLVGTSTNLLVDSLAREHGEPGFAMFDFAPMGAVYAVVGLAYCWFLLGRLPERRESGELTAKYQLTPYLTEVRVPKGSPLVGRTVVEEKIADRFRLTVLEIVRGARKIAFDLRSTPIEADDVLIVRGTMHDIVQLKEALGLLLLSDVKLSDADLAGAETVLVEVQLAPTSSLEGSTLKEVDFRRRFGAFVLALARTGEVMREKLASIPLRRWDTLLLLGHRRQVEQLLGHDDFLPLQEIDLRLRLHPRWWLQALTVVGVVLVAATGQVPLLAAALVGVVLLLASGAARVQRVYRSVNWSVFFLLAASIPLGIALERAGLAARAGEAIADLGQRWGPWGALSALYFVTMVATELLSNAATAVILVPIALTTAAALGADPRPFLFAVAFAASNGFVTPLGYQTNAMVYGAGNYRYSDFLKAGVPLNLLFWLLSSLLIPVFWPF
jgi:di/tricarboxylate transporter